MQQRTHEVTHSIMGSKHKTTSNAMAPVDCQGLRVSRSSGRNSQWYLLNVRVELLLVSPRGGGITEKCTLHHFCVGHGACGATVGQGQALGSLCCQHQSRGRVSGCRVSVSRYSISTFSKYNFFKSQALNPLNTQQKYYTIPAHSMNW